ncbi:MAG: hypothetical protein WGN25_03165 [Candidatus Electrothrix sp. GW3-4]|uniref:hypothetical protein n=1 Tax=Candidatus Electrothrix sp. GW3-4 TaxID=3126740 RepID=UPI0030D05065
MAAKKPPFESSPCSTSASPTQDIEPEKNQLIERIVAKAIQKHPEQSEEELRAIAHASMDHLTQLLLKHKEIIIGDEILYRLVSGDENEPSPPPRPGEEHLFHVDVRIHTPKIPGLKEDKFPPYLPPDLTTKH